MRLELHTAGTEAGGKNPQEVHVHMIAQCSTDLAMIKALFTLPNLFAAAVAAKRADILAGAKDPAYADDLVKMAMAVALGAQEEDLTLPTWMEMVKTHGANGEKVDITPTTQPERDQLLSDFDAAFASRKRAEEDMAFAEGVPASRKETIERIDAALVKADLIKAGEFIGDADRGRKEAAQRNARKQQMHALGISGNADPLYAIMQAILGGAGIDGERPRGPNTPLDPSQIN